MISLINSDDAHFLPQCIYLYIYIYIFYIVDIDFMMGDSELAASLSMNFLKCFET